MPLSDHLNLIRSLQQELPAQKPFGRIAGWRRAYFYDEICSLATGEAIFHVMGCPNVDCEICDLERWLSDLFFEALEAKGRLHGYGIVQLGKDGEATVDLLEDDRLVAVVKADMKGAFSLEEFDKVDGLQMEIDFEEGDTAPRTVCLQRENGSWSSLGYLMQTAYFLSLRETNGNDITRMVIHMEGDDFWIASDPPKPNLGFVSIEHADVAFDGKLGN